MQGDSVRRLLLYTWAASLPIHQLPIAAPWLRLGAGEWLFPLALLAAASWVTTTALRGSLKLLVPLAIGFAPAVVCSMDPPASLLQLGVVLYVATILLVAFEAARRGHGSVVLAGFVCGVVMSCVWGWVRPQIDPWLAPGWPRPVGPTESPNMLAIQACTGALSAAVLARDAGNPVLRRTAIAIAVGLVATALATLGHVVLAALVAGLFVACRARHRRRAVATATKLAFAAATVLLVLSARVRLLPLSIVAPFFDRRPNLYSAAHTVDLETFAGSPFAGVGLECFAKAWPHHDDGVRFAANFAGGQEHLVGLPIDTHSTWLGYLAEGGLAGGLVLAVLVALALRARRDARPELDVALVFAAGVGVFADVLTNRELALVTGALAGLGAREANRHAIAPPLVRSDRGP